ncbi:MFS transporter [Actibacterium mucosum KCTC 23349]|uniref:MFS transporter n=1 Tax=Actibacterium mucosum KCTC 23349 TaxID=1454373 RepID=A0A037ZP11_9RHOB|nr:MFS transporter [Actibacterium mucosum]KAJ56556.1 MFS transporter [Actibacterium mucosum KCTC 23349]
MSRPPSTLSFLRDNLRWIGGGIILTFLSGFGQTFFISVFAGEIRAEFELTHAGWGAVYAAGTLASAAVMVWAGALSDRYRMRGLGTIVLIGLALACVAMAGNRAVWGLVVVIFALRFFGQGMASHVARVAMARWFVATRGRALALVTLGFSAGEALLPISALTLTTLIGWRVVWVGAAIVIVAFVPLLLSLLKQERTPQSDAQNSDAAGMRGRHWTRAQMLRHGLFWMLVPLLLGPPAFGTAVLFHQVHMAEVKDWTQFDFVAMLPIFTVVSLFSMMAFGWAIDQFGSRRLIALYQIPFALAMLALWIGDSQMALAGAFVLFGLMQGGGATLTSSIWAELYGTAHLGGIKALASALMVFGSAIGPGVTGYLIDHGISFPNQGPGIALFILAASGLAAIGLYRYRD